MGGGSTSNTYTDIGPTSSRAFGGGGATDIRIGGTALNNRVLVAGGGGGDASGTNGVGGDGGGLTGGNGADALFQGAGGRGGTQSAGGAGGSDIGGPVGGAGVSGIGGNGTNNGRLQSSGSPNDGGGGGGGYFGGGGGGTGGGGGSSFANPTLITSFTHTQGARSGNGLLTISYRAISSLSATVSGNLSVCAGQSTNLTALAGGGTAPYSYTWAAPAGITLSGGSTSVVQATAGAGVSGTRTLTVTVQDATGPTSRTTVTASLTVTNVSVSITPTPSATVTPGNAVTLTASGATSYTWSDNSTTNPLILGSVTSNTTISVTGVTGACSNTASVTVFAITLPDAPTLSASTSVVCEGTTVTVTGSTTSTVTGYQWYKDGVSLGAAQQTPTLTLSGALPSQSGNYSLVVSNGVGSATSAAFSLTVNPQPTVTLLFGGATQSMVGPNLPLITLTSPLDPNNLPVFQVFGGVYYERLGWIDQVNGYQIKCYEPSSTGVFKINQLGRYSITVTGANGCKRTVEGMIRN